MRGNEERREGEGTCVMSNEAEIERKKNRRQKLRKRGGVRAETIADNAFEMDQEATEATGISPQTRNRREG